MYPEKLAAWGGKRVETAASGTLWSSAFPRTATACIKPDKISLEIEDAEEDWDAPDVVIRRAGEDWIQIDRPFARADKVDLLAVLNKVGSTGTIGGLVVMDEQIMLRHALPLTEAVEPDEVFENAWKYEGPLGGIVDAATLFGRQLAGHDGD
ncbi:hypothetical protein IU459_32095 [Nocardia amamiensis]|uniref:Uncharacterized protein n=1 Tax=Nocardia amamiensis TaxID=404578 RepID=A0ABS0D2B8_9NOCA|nr:hypothetical protein [Nocardia amamiensis]MBF6302147.1 hypothetical protein [Nocardia amamiensis]